MAFGLEAVMPIEFHILSLRVQVTKKLSETQYKQYRLEQLLELKENRIARMAQLEQRQRQRQRKAFVDRHHKGTEKSFALRKQVLVFRTKLGSMLGKLRFYWTCPFWMIDDFNDTFQLRTLASDII